MRLTIAANYAHGTKITGERATNRRKYLMQYLDKQTTEWFEDLASDIQLDRRLESEVNSYDARMLVEDYLDCPSIRGRGKYDPCLSLKMFSYCYSLADVTCLCIFSSDSQSSCSPLPS